MKSVNFKIRLMSIIKNIFSLAANGIGTKNLLFFTGKLVVHSFYHTVSDEYLSHISPLYRPKIKAEFVKDIDFLQQHFQAISIKEVYLQQQKKTILQKNSFHLSFDDGLREVHEVILPILYQKGIPATVFVNNDFVDNKNLFFRHKAALIVETLNKKEISATIKKEIEHLLTPKEPLQSQVLNIGYAKREILDTISALLDIDFQDYLKNQRPYLTTDMLTEMQTKGFTIGAHSIDHPQFSKISEEEQIRQIVESCSYVKTVFNESHSFFSFPFTDENISASVFNAIDNQIDLSFGIKGIRTSNNGKHIARIDFEKSGNSAKQSVNKALLKFLIKK